MPATMPSASRNGAACQPSEVGQVAHLGRDRPAQLVVERLTRRRVPPVFERQHLQESQVAQGRRDRSHQPVAVELDPRDATVRIRGDAEPRPERPFIQPPGAVGPAGAVRPPVQPFERLAVLRHTALGPDVASRAQQAGNRQQPHHHRVPSPDRLHRVLIHPSRARTAVPPQARNRSGRSRLSSSRLPPGDLVCVGGPVPAGSPIAPVRAASVPSARYREAPIA